MLQHEELEEKKCEILKLFYKSINMIFDSSDKTLNSYFMHVEKIEFLFSKIMLISLNKNS